MQQDAKRGTSAERGYNWTWHKVRNMKLAENPICECCEKNGKITIAVLVHHRDRNPRNNMKNNLESLCGMCHQEEHKEDRKTLDSLGYLVNNNNRIHGGRANV